MRRLLAILLVLTLSVLSFSACSNGETVNDMGNGTQSDNTEENQMHILNGKKIIFIGDSFVYYGNVVLEKTQSVLSQDARQNDEGYFYQLCKTNGAEVEVTNWTFGGHGLHSFGPDACATSKSCKGKNHMEYLTDRNYDYVVISGGRSTASVATFIEDMQYLMGVFKEANPNVKFLYLVSSGAHNVSVKETFPVNVLNNLKTIDGWGVTVVDWGKLVKNIIDGEVSVPNSTIQYNKNSFVVSQTKDDGYHPNQLSGYITALMTYCAITGEKAEGQKYDFCGDTSICSSGKYASFDKFIATYYKNGATTNYKEIFASETDMLGIQKLIDAHLSEKAYLNYNY